jgi:hypothetical protein
MTCAKTGSIPTEYGKLINLTNLDVGDNHLTGTRQLLTRLLGSVDLLYCKRPHVCWQGRSPLNSASSST